MSHNVDIWYGGYLISTHKLRTSRWSSGSILPPQQETLQGGRKAYEHSSGMEEGLESQYPQDKGLLDCLFLKGIANKWLQNDRSSTLQLKTFSNLPITRWWPSFPEIWDTDSSTEVYLYMYVYLYVHVYVCTHISSLLSTFYRETWFH